MKISVVIPCRNEEKHIAHCVTSLMENGYDPAQLEILVVDGQSTDKTRAEIARIQQHYPQVRLIDNPKKLTPHALNLGVFAATGDYILIASAHSAFSPGYIGQLKEQLEKLEGALAVGGVMRTEVKNSTPVSLAIKAVLSHRFGVGNATFRIGTNEIREVDTVPFGLYRTRELQAIGGYNERLIRNHDMEMSKRLAQHGGKIYLLPSAHCTYYARETYGQMAKNNFNNGKWNVLTVFITKNPGSLSIRHFVPLAFVLSLVLPALLALLWTPFIGLSALALAMYLFAVGYFAISMRQPGTTIIHIMIAFLVLHFAYGWGSIIGFFSIPRYTRS